MRSLICLVIIIALAGLTGCAKQEPVPSADPEAQADTQEISNEDFESGEVEAVEVEVDGEDEGDDPAETP